MRYNKNLEKIVKYFLPKGAQITQIKEYYETPAILEGDIDEDGQEEIIALYEREEKKYILVIKMFSNRWHVIWNSKIDFLQINKFNLGKVMQEGRQIIIGGLLESTKEGNLVLLKWENEELYYMLDTPIKFDKCYIQDIDGKDGIQEIVIWKHKELEAFDISIFRYDKGTLKEDISLYPYYFKEVVKYYEFLCQAYPEEGLYNQCLRESKKKCLQNKEEENKQGLEEITDNMDILLALTGYVCVQGEEEDIYLVGKREIKDDIEYITSMKLIISLKNENRFNIVNVEGEQIYKYEIFLGEFMEEDIECIWIGVTTNQFKENKAISIYAYLNGEFKKIFQHLEEDCIEIYPVDRFLKGKYEICCMKGEKPVQTWFRWKEGEFEPYRQFKIDGGGKVV